MSLYDIMFCNWRRPLRSKRLTCQLLPSYVFARELIAPLAHTCLCTHASLYIEQIGFGFKLLWQAILIDGIYPAEGYFFALLLPCFRACNGVTRSPKHIYAYKAIIIHTAEHTHTHTYVHTHTHTHTYVHTYVHTHTHAQTHTYTHTHTHRHRHTCNCACTHCLRYSAPPTEPTWHPGDSHWR